MCRACEETKRGNRISPNYLHCPKFTHTLTLGSKISTAQFMPYPSILSLSILTKKTISLFLLLICAYKRCIFFKMGHYHCMMEKSCQATNFYLLCRSLGIVDQVWNIFAGKDPPENIWKIFLELWYTSEGLDHLRIYLLIIVDWKHEFVCNICTYLGNIFCVMWNMFGGF